jgi:hypothetical protein
MIRNFFVMLTVLFSFNTFADDWGAPASTIETMYIYPTYVVVVQSAGYSGTAGCSQPAAWSFYWNDFDSATQQRIYTALLAAKLSKVLFKPVFSSSGCGPEGYKKFNGLFVL